MKLDEMSTLETRVNRKLKVAAQHLSEMALLRREPQPSRLVLMWKIWRLGCAVPQLRLGQLLANAIEVGGSRKEQAHERLFYITDAELLRRLEGYERYSQELKEAV